MGAGGGKSSPGIFLPGCPLPPFGHDGIISVCSPEVCGGFATYLFNGAGTSFSAPAVSGVAALAKGRYPSMNGNQLRSHLKKTADDIGRRGPDNDFGHGRVNADKATQ